MRQYWRDFESLGAWTRTLPHQAWWRDFLRDSGGAGFWHELYSMRGGMEAVYDDMPGQLGFGKFAPRQRAHGRLFGARGRRIARSRGRFTDTDRCRARPRVAVGTSAVRGRHRPRGRRGAPSGLPWASVTGIEPELWVDHASAAVEFYEAAFGATVLHRVGQGDDIVVQLAVAGAAFWVAAASPDMKRFSPQSIDGATGRTLLVVDDPDSALQRAIDAGAREVDAVTDEHGWRLGRILDPFGHEWEIGRPLGEWPPT
jgi:PhnB protein